MCNGALGKTFPTHSPQYYFDGPPNGHNSTKIHSNSEFPFDVVIVTDSNAILPAYLVAYTVDSPISSGLTTTQHSNPVQIKTESRSPEGSQHPPRNPSIPALTSSPVQGLAVVPPLSQGRAGESLYLGSRFVESPIEYRQSSVARSSTLVSQTSSSEPDIVLNKKEDHISSRSPRSRRTLLFNPREVSHLLEFVGKLLQHFRDAPSIGIPPGQMMNTT